ncbi:MAG: YceI family protein, partial [Myxococcota bacterium]
MIATLLLGAAAQAAPTSYTLDAGKSRLFVIVRNDTSTVASGLGHDHAIVAQRFDGKVTWDPDDLSVCNVSISLPVDGLFPDPPGYREIAGLDPDGAVDDGAKKQIKKNFLKGSQLDGSRFPSISYQSSRCAPSSVAGRVDVTGTLSIRGVGLEVTVPMKVSAGPSSFAADGRFEASHGDFGFKPFTNLLGALRNLD